MPIRKIEQSTTNKSFADEPDSLRNKDNLIAEQRKKIETLESQLKFQAFFIPMDLPPLLRTQAE